MLEVVDTITRIVLAFLTGFGLVVAVRALRSLKP